MDPVEKAVELARMKAGTDKNIDETVAVMREQQAPAHVLRMIDRVMREHKYGMNEVMLDDIDPDTVANSVSILNANIMMEVPVRLGMNHNQAVMMLNAMMMAMAAHLKSALDINIPHVEGSEH